MKKGIASFLTVAFMVTNVGVSTLTSYAAEETTFTAVVNVYNEETQEPVKGIDVKFVEYDADLPTIPEPQADIVQVLSEWNTSDTNPYEIPDVAFVKGHFYAVQIDNIPEGYCYSWEDHVITGIHGNGTLTGTVNYNIALQPHNPLPKVEYPLDIEREFTFSVVDKSTNQVIEGLDVELAKMELDANVVNKYNYVETVDSWTTAADSYAITIPITYDTYESPSAVYGIKINNMPEGYTYYQEPEDGYTVCGYYGAYDYRYDLYKDNKTTECIAYIYPEGKPHVYTSTKISDNTTTTTTTTTTAANELYFNSQYGYVPVEIGFNSGISLAGYDDGKFYEVGDSPIEFTIDDETIAKVGVVQGVGVNVLGVSVGETVLNAKAPDGRTASIKVVVKEAPSTSTTAVWNNATTTTTTTTASVEEKEIYFQYLNPEKGYCTCQVGEITGLYLANYDDGLYEIGETPIDFKIEDQNIAVISQVQGSIINIKGVTVGETVLNAKTPDGQSASVKIVVEEAVVTTSTAVWNEETTTTTTTTTTVPDADDPITTSTAVLDYATFLEYDSSPMKVGETRTVRFYNPELKTMTNMNAYEVSDNISYSYEEGSDTLTITALAPGKVRMYIMGEGCAFGCYLNIEVVDDSLPQTGYSNIYKVIAGLAALMTVSGAALVIKTRKENE